MVSQPSLVSSNAATAQIVRSIALKDQQHQQHQQHCAQHCSSNIQCVRLLHRKYRHCTTAAQQACCFMVLHMFSYVNRIIAYKQ
jgi:hypothetical protein